MKESNKGDDWSVVDDGTTNADGNKKHTPLWQTISTVYHKRIATDPNSDWYDDWDGFVAYCMKLWQKQKMICKISKGRMDLERGPTQPSLDAKDAAKGHVKRNLQFVCVFLQSSQVHGAVEKTFKDHKNYCKYLGVPTRK